MRQRSDSALSAVQPQMKAFKLPRSSRTWDIRNYQRTRYYGRYYAVAVGRGGPKIYESWEECQAQISKWPQAQHKSFVTLESAREWLRGLGVGAKLLRPSKLDHNSVPRNLEDGVMVIVSDEAGNSIIHDHRVSLPIQQNETPPAPNEHTPSPAPEVILLSTEQQEVLDIVRAGDNVFFTGPAGTGKSVLLREIIKLKGGRASHELGVTAATGIAATNIGGTTLHSWSGVGLGRKEVLSLVQNILGQKNLRKRWTNVETLIIDEISMIDGNFFDKLENIARSVRGDERPFGGIQLVLSGDFCQLPPVNPRNEEGKITLAKFAFAAKTWESCVGKPVTLKQVFRQKDQAFVEILNAMRFGRVSEDAKVVLAGLSRKVEYDDGVEPTELFPTRREVDSANNTQLQQLSGPTYTYIAKDSPGNLGFDDAEKLLETMLVAPRVVRLRVGAQVMLVKNFVRGVLVNGTVGIITKFLTIEEALRTRVKLLEPHSNASGSTPHKSLHALRWDDLWPVVDFRVPSTSDSRGKITVLCIPREFTVNNAVGETEAKRVQIPIILAWALSVHKCQGQTLDRVKVDLKKTFENGQAYCAISRATTMERLQIISFNRSKVMAHKKVLKWHRKNNLGGSQLLLQSPNLEDAQRNKSKKERKKLKKAQKNSQKGTEE